MNSTYWQRPLSRRRAIKGGAMGVMGAGMLLAGMGCQDDDSSGSTATATATAGGSATGTEAPAGEGTRGGQLRHALDLDPVSFDPHIEASFRTQFAGVGNAYNSLMMLTPDLEAVPDLASEVEVLDDGSVRFQLHEGVKFHDIAPVSGRVLTSEDVVASIERIRTDAPEFQRAYMFEQITGFETPDDRTVIMKFAEPFAPLFNYIANPFSAIIPREALDATGDLRQVVIGTGPFVQTRMDMGSTFELQRNPDYFRPELPYLDSIRIDVMPDASSRLAALRAGELTIETRPTPDDALLFQGDDRWEVLEHSQEGQATVRYNCAAGPFTDERLRKAFDLALIRQENIDLVLGGQGYLSGPVGPGLGDRWSYTQDQLSGTPGYREDKEEDYAEARKLLEAAGQTDFTPKFIYYTPAVTNETNAVAIQQQLARAGIGITVTLEHLDYAAWIPQMLDQSYELTVTTSGFRDNPDEYLYALFATGASRNDTGYSNADLDQLLNAQRLEMDEDARSELVFQIQDQLMEDVPNSWLYSAAGFQIHSSKLKGYRATFAHNAPRQFVNAWLEA